MPSITKHNPFEGFSKLKREQRVEKLKELTQLTDEDFRRLSGSDGAGLSLDQAEHLIENVVGLYALPLGVATGFLIDDHDMTVPIMVEETSIIAATSASAK